MSTLTVLGIAQDGGVPQAGCQRACCARHWRSGVRFSPACLGVWEGDSCWLIDATPALPEQLTALRPHRLAGVLLTHAHIGHYTGLMYLGREAMNADQIPVWGMPRMRSFLEQHGPWEALIRNGNIQLRDIREPVTLGTTTATAFEVNHRDEYSETVGYRLTGPSRSALYLPDIDALDDQLLSWIEGVDLAFIDGTFFSPGELPHRDPTQVPHPFIEDTLTRLAMLSDEHRDKVHFIHLNHTNPALDPQSAERQQVHRAGCHIAEQGASFSL